LLDGDSFFNPITFSKYSLRALWVSPYFAGSFRTAVDIDTIERYR
jgi:hypothetical protein